MSSRKALLSALVLAGVISAHAQSSSNSPYTRYGLGDLSDRGFTSNAAMGGIGYALRNSEHINLTNPASISSVDSLSFMFDAGMSLKSSNYKENNIRNNARNASFDYLAMQFRIHPRIGLAIACTPFSTVGYNFKVTAPVQGNESVTATNTFYGDGGFQQITAGLGFKICNNLSVGVNAGYLYGSVNYQTSAAFSVSSDQTNVYNKIKVNSYVADFGLQYSLPINKSHRVTLGAVYGLGHTLHSTETKGIQVTDNSNYVSSEETYVKNGYGIPHSLGVGVAYQKKNNLTVGVDYTFQKWSNTKYNNTTGFYTDRSKIAAGAEFLPNRYGRSFLKRIRYRAGAYYSTSYMKLPQYDGPSEYGISAGFGFPMRLFQSNTMLDLTGQYVRVNPSVPNMLAENRFVIKIGLTFNEHWFMKWKVK